jgi:hypothetical protein
MVEQHVIPLQLAADAHAVASGACQDGFTAATILALQSKRMPEQRIGSMPAQNVCFIFPTAFKVGF